LTDGTMTKIDDVKVNKQTKADTVPASVSRVPKQLTPWKPGQSGNPAGRKPGSRNKLVEDFVSDLQEKWRTDGADILDRVAANEPAKIVEVISRLAPKDIAVKLDERNSLGVEPALWNGFKRVLAAIEECAPADTNPVQVFDAMERWVRSEFAVPIEGASGKQSLITAQDPSTEK